MIIILIILKKKISHPPSSKIAFWKLQTELACGRHQLETINRGCAHTSESNSQRTALTAAREIPILLVKERSWCAPKLQKMEAGPTAHLLASFVKVTCLLTKRRRRSPWQQTVVNRRLIGAQISVSDRDLWPRLNEPLHSVTIIIIITIKNTAVWSGAEHAAAETLYYIASVIFHCR